MPEGLKLVVSADVTQAEKELKKLVTDAQKAGTDAARGLDKGLSKVPQAINKIPAAAKPATIAVSRLGATLEDLRAKLGARQDFLVREKDIAKVAILNREIKELETEIARVKNIGAPGFDALGNAVQKTGGAFSGVVSAGQGAFSVLRKIAFIVPGIGIAGLVGGLADLVIGLFKSEQGLDKTAVAAAKFAAAMKDAEEGVKGFVDSLDFGADLEKLQNELKLGKGAKLDLVNFEVDKTKNDKIIAQANEEITQLTDKILAIRRDAQFTLSKKGAALLDTFFNDLEIPDGLIDDLDSKSRDVIRQLKVDATKIKALEDERKKAFQDNQKSLLESQIKSREDQAKEFDKLFKQTIDQAQKLEEFFSKSAFPLHFDFNPQAPKSSEFKRAKDFITKALATEFVSIKANIPIDLGLLLRFDRRRTTDFLTDEVTKEAPKTYAEVKKEFEDRVKKIAGTNPLVIETNAKIKLGRENEDKMLKLMEDRAKNLASVVSDTLTPAFGGLFSAIKAGENPIKGFFDSLGQQVEQLIEKLIAAAIQAAILSAIFPGGVGGVKGFGGIFKSILGFAGGGIVSGPQLALIGEGIGTNKSNPEVVAPLDRLRGLLAGLAPQQSANGNLSATIRGNNILLSNNRTNRTNRRLGAR